MNNIDRARCKLDLEGCVFAKTFAQTHLFLFRHTMIAHLSFTKSSSRHPLVTCLTLTNFPIAYANVWIFGVQGNKYIWRE